jgi:hypothetical protein
MSAAGGRLDASVISLSNYGSYIGSGGGTGNSGGYYYYPGFAGHGGAGAGSIAIICQGTITVNSGARLEAHGGDGIGPGVASFYYNSGSYFGVDHSAGGGGSGGTIYLAANNIVIAPAVTESVTSGATFDLAGGYGGGWRQNFSGTRNRYPWYQSYGNFGGDGGYGRLVIDYRTSLNNGRPVANRFGYEQTTFTDASNQYKALAGQATFKCRSTPGGTYFRSKFADLMSVRPTVDSLTFGAHANDNTLLQGQGAQSQPFANAVDTSNVSSVVNAAGSNMNFNGWRYWRFLGVMTRLSSSGVSPYIDNVAWGYTTDN